jgi:uncharacterized protein (TIGR04255 family)
VGNALGVWRNPPLAYVVAELVISPYYKLAEHVAELQEALRTEYPRTIESQTLLVEASKAADVQGVWHFLSADQNRGVLLGREVIALHATAYSDSDDFVSRWERVLLAVQSSGLKPFAIRAGLRYVDLIVPTRDNGPAAYLVESLRGVSPTGAVNMGSVWAAGFQQDGHQINLRIGAPSPSGVVLPPNFNALPLKKPEVMQRAEEHVKRGAPIGFIDTDCLREINEELQVTEVKDAYKAMQRQTFSVFKSALSDTAMEEWQ